MESISLKIPPEIVAQIKLPPKRAQRVLMEELVLRLYEEGIISTGQGAYLLKMDRLSFERFMAEHCIAIHCDIEELDQDISHLDQAL